MSTNKINFDNQALISKWLQAKENEAGWNAIRKETEEAIVAEIGEEGMEELWEQVTGMTKKMALCEEIELSFGYDRKLDSVAVMELVTEHPSLIGTVFKAEYKPIDSRTFNRAAEANTQVGHALSRVYEDVRRGPYFSKKKAS